MMRIRVPWLPLIGALAAVVISDVAVCQASEEPAEQEDAPIDLQMLRADRMVKAIKHPVRSRISRYLGAAAKASDAGTPEEAIALLGKLNPQRLNPYERVLVYRLMAYVSYTSGDYDGAIEYFERVLAEETLPLDAENKIRFNIAQINASLQRWPETIAALDRWFRYAEEEEPLAYYLLGIAHYQNGNLELALEKTAKAVDLAPEPREGWLQLLAALYIQGEDYPSATPILEELVMRFPKKQYWVQLSLIYGARDNYRASLAVQQVAYAQDLLAEDKELRRLARSYLYHDLPYPAAQVLETGLEKGQIEADADSYELLANSLIASREYDRSLPPLRKAAELAEDGNLFVRLGQVHLQREEWPEAAEQLRLALEKGGLKKTGSAQLLLGIALYNDARIEQARVFFGRASEHEDTRDAAARWITHIEKETQSG
jgi:tetratricopeptide (TPR) repeat protein